MRRNNHTFRVIYGDTDTMGVVYYANYLRYFEAGRNELMRALGVSYRGFEKAGYALPVTHVRAEYRAPARYDDELTLETKLSEVRRGSMRIEYELSRPADNVLIATGETRHACVGPSGRVCRFPEEINLKLSVAGRHEGGTHGS